MVLVTWFFIYLICVMCRDSAGQEINQTDCGAGYYMQEGVCGECGTGFYKNTTGSGPCIACPSNTITLSPGATSQLQCIQVPSLLSMFPLYGPLAGKTLVTFTISSDDWNLTAINIASQPCGKLEFNRAWTCLTSRTNQLGPGPVELHFTSDEGQYLLTASSNFTYMADPVIIAVSPNKSIVAGGLPIHVYGSHLTSVAQPQLFVTYPPELHQRESVYSQCKVQNESYMLCTGPNLGLTGLHLDTAASITEVFHVIFHAGLYLDGLQTYTNLSGVVPNFNYLDIYRNPNCTRSDYVFMKGTDITIDGVYLDLVAKNSDIDISIGSAKCDFKYLYRNAIICTPPPIAPANDPKPRITVTFGAGPLAYTIGKLDYTRGGNWQVALGVSLGVVAALILLVAVVIWKIRESRQKSLLAVKRQPSTTTPNDYVLQRGGSVNEGYLSPTPSHTSTPDNHSSMASRSTASGLSSQSRPSLAELQTRASLASLTLSLVKQRTTSTGSGLSSPPLSPLSSILETDPGPVPAAPSVPMSSNMAYFLQPHKMAEVQDDMPMLAAQGTILDKSRLTIGDSIGKGFFGNVYKGTLFDENGNNGTTVAVKTVQGIQCSDGEVAAFLHEAIIMKAFNHENVLALLAVVMDEGRPYVVLPFMEHGDLKSYVSDASKQFTVLQLLGFGVQVANGMAYLTDQKFVHRDLACRNCMINKELCVKIADFGLSRDVYYSQYYRVETKHRPLPVKWMAIESLAEGVFSTKTDVWSFGVLLWELMTRGCPPYADVDGYKMKAFLKSGHRLDKPPHINDQMYSLMMSCWKDLPEDRPTFRELQRHLQDIVEDKEPPHDYLQLIE